MQGAQLEQSGEAARMYFGFSVLCTSSVHSLDIQLSPRSNSHSTVKNLISLISSKDPSALFSRSKLTRTAITIQHPSYPNAKNITTW